MGMVEPFQMVQRRGGQVHGHGRLLLWLKTRADKRLCSLVLLVSWGLGLGLRRLGRGGTRGQGRRCRRGFLTHDVVGVCSGNSGSILVVCLLILVQIAHVHFLAVQDRKLGGGDAVFHSGG